MTDIQTQQPTALNNNTTSSTTSRESDSAPQSQSQSQSHPLQQRWTLHFNGAQDARRAAWDEAVKKVMTITTVEQFWLLYNSIKQPSTLGKGANYHFFLDNVKPEWEDTRNKDGGRWRLSINKNSESAKHIDTIWLHTLLLLIGNTLTHHSDVTGVVAAPRAKEYRIDIWTSNYDENSMMSIGNEWKKICQDITSQANNFEFSAFHNDRINYRL